VFLLPILPPVKIFQPVLPTDREFTAEDTEAVLGEVESAIKKQESRMLDFDTKASQHRQGMWPEALTGGFRKLTEYLNFNLEFRRGRRGRRGR
jgi:hypothetical protein